MSQHSTQTSLALLYEISRQLVSSLDIETVLSKVLTISADNVGAERGMLIVLDEEQKPTQAAIVYQGRLMAYTQSQLESILEVGLAGWVLRKYQPVLVPDTSKDDRWLHRPDDDKDQSGPKSAICLPILLVGNVLVGVITIVHPEPGFFTEEHLKLLQAIADQAAIAIYNARLYQSLEIAHLRYRELFEDSIDPIIITDWNGKIIEANRIALHKCGYDLSDLKRRTIVELHDVNWDILGVEFANLSTGLRALSYDSEMRCIEYGKVIPVEVHVYKVSINDQDHLQWVFRDITERKELQTLQEELLAMIYHDLRSPLSNVVSSLEIIKSMVPAESVAFIEPIVDIAMRSTERVKRLANSLLDINRLESGQPIIDPKEVRIQRLVNVAIDTVRHTADAKSLQIESQVADGLPSVIVDEEMIQRVLINLLENAVKFTPTNGSIVVGATASETSLQLCVEDTGLGILENARERIFDKFTRIKMENVPRGIGLGLAFCRLALEAHGGKIWVEPNEPQGSRFCFTLPVKAPFA